MLQNSKSLEPYMVSNYDQHFYTLFYLKSLKILINRWVEININEDEFIKIWWIKN